VPEQRFSRHLNSNAAVQKPWKELVGPVGQALEALREHREEIDAAWRAEQSTLGLTPAQLDVLAGGGLSAVENSIRPGRWQSFHRNILLLAEQIAALGIGLEQALNAYRARLEICLPYLETETSARKNPATALLRYFALFAAVLALGYERSHAGEKTRISHSKALPSLTEAYERERRQLSHDLHDEIGHDLMLLKLNLETLRLDFKQQDAESTGIQLGKAIAMAERVIASVRRIVLTLGPTILEELGFVPAMQYYAHRFAQSTGIETTVNVGALPEPIPVSHQLALYRILQGALSNVLKHAHARRVTVDVGSINRSMLIMVIQDDGAGFNTQARRLPTSVGLTAMRERAESLGGRVHIQSRRKSTRACDRGTRIEIDLPLRR
jgi:signal transduction histidine kinase